VLKQGRVLTRSSAYQLSEAKLRQGNVQPLRQGRQRHEVRASQTSADGRPTHEQLRHTSTDSARGGRERLTVRVPAVHRFYAMKATVAEHAGKPEASCTTTPNARVGST